MFALLAILLGCTPNATHTDTSNHAENDIDSGAGAGAGAGAVTDTGASTQTGSEGRDPADGFGSILGHCGLITAEELNSDEPLFLRNSIDFGTDTLDETLLTTGGQEIISDGNLGGSSVLSEVFSFEVLNRCELAVLLKTESEIVYDDPDSKKTDLLVEIDSTQVGVSVTRAYGYPPEDPYLESDAEVLLNGKLSDVLISTAAVSNEDGWHKQILHILAYEPRHADSVYTAWSNLDHSITADTIVVVTVTEGEDSFIY